ncbi:rhodanese-like domain-containing protein [Sanguibacter sp. YZGR15]|uniref:Rhodanese-like domain-containing protein n=1 Tax=Sanguibacter suaedae TaxID=2795737 RepID=A0A934I7Z6_9MICO|nr:rhodanese-like domain-containing protein [Sanguibacter suaedae]
MREVDIPTTETALADGAYVVDVREDEEYVAGHVPGVHHVPLSSFVEQHSTIPADGTVYVICAAGVRSLQAAQFLEAQGYDAVSVAGGTQEWARSGRPVETGR